MTGHRSPRTRVREELVSSRDEGERRASGGGKLRPYRFGAWLTMVTVALFRAADVLACPVCYGEADNSFIDGAKLSVIFMGALVYVLIGGGIALAVIVHRRAVKNLDPHRGLRLLPPERG